MVLGLEKAGLISWQPRVPRSIQLLVDPAASPDLLPGYDQSVKNPVQRYWMSRRGSPQRSVNS
jgi:hypothetical protein